MKAKEDYVTEEVAVALLIVTAVMADSDEGDDVMVTVKVMLEVVAIVMR